MLVCYFASFGLFVRVIPSGDDAVSKVGFTLSRSTLLRTDVLNYILSAICTRVAGHDWAHLGGGLNVYQDLTGSTVKPSEVFISTK